MPRDRDKDQERKRPARTRAVDQDETTLVEGRNAVTELLRAGRACDKVFLAEGAHTGDIGAMARERGIPVVVCDRRKLDGMSPTGNHQGVIAQAAAHEYASLDDLFAAAERAGEPPLFIICDGIADPHNLGAIIRSAECAGAHGVILPERRAAGLGPAAAKAAAGALNYLPIARVKNLNRTIDELKQRGVWVIGTAMDGEDALTADLTGPVALVIGSEGEGISHLTLQKCDRTVTLPMKGQIVSLNASVAAGILMYEIVRARAK